MKKIGLLMIDSLPMPPIKGGAVENLTQSIIEHNEVAGDFEFHVFSVYAEGVSNATKKTYYHYYNPQGPLLLWEFVIRVVRYVFRHYFNTYLSSYYEIQAKRLFKHLGIATVVLENCPYSAICLNKNSEFQIIQHLHNDYLHEHNNLIDQLLSRSQKILAVSQFIKSRIAPIVPKRIPIDVCYNGIDLSRYDSKATEDELSALRQKYGIGKSDKVIIYVGRLVVNKGVKELIQAFKAVSSQYEDWKLLIVGGLSFSDNFRDSYVDELYSIASEMGDRVVITGYIDSWELPKYYQLASLSAVPSICFESFSLSTLEAMASGVPAIVSDAGGMLEVVDDKCSSIVKRGETFVDDLAKAMDNVMSDENQLNRMASFAKERAKKFSAEAMYASFKKSLL